MHDRDDDGIENPLPEGDYAIVECFGHRTLVGRIAEVERYGTTMCAIEPVFGEALLPTIYLGGGALYGVTPCSRDVAWARRPRHGFQLPPALRAILPAAALAAPGEFADEHLLGDDEY